MLKLMFEHIMEILRSKKMSYPLYIIVALKHKSQCNEPQQDVALRHKNSDQPMHQIRVIAVHMKKACVSLIISYPLSAQRSL